MEVDPAGRVRQFTSDDSLSQGHNLDWGRGWKGQGLPEVVTV